GPQFLLARTYRLKGHTASDLGAYRPAGEVEARKADDPLKRPAEMLKLGGVAEAKIAAIDNETRAEIAAAWERAMGAPWPAAAPARREAICRFRAVRRGRAGQPGRQGSLHVRRPGPGAARRAPADRDVALLGRSAFAIAGSLVRAHPRPGGRLPLHPGGQLRA